MSGIEVKVGASFQLFGIEFEPKATISEDEILLEGQMSLKDKKDLTLGEILEKLLSRIGVSEFGDFAKELTVKALFLKLNFKNHDYLFGSQIGISDSNLILHFSLKKQEKGVSITLGLSIEGGIGISNIPIIGEKLEPYFDLNLSEFIVNTKAIEDESFKRPIFSKKPNKPKESEEPKELDISYGEEGINLERGISLFGFYKFLDHQKDFQLLVVPFSKKKNSEDDVKARSVTSQEKEEFEKSSGLSKIFNLNKQIGPINLKRIGLEYKENKVGVMIDAAISIMGLTVSVKGLKIRSSIAFPPELSFNIDGVGISFSRDPIGIAGAFMKIETEGYQRYLGLVALKVPKFTIIGIGGYSIKIKDPSQKSLFGFVALNAPLGGIAEFFVMGLAGGFGFNSTLTIPKISELEKFIFLKPEEIFEKDTLFVLEKLQDYIEPQPNGYWLAFGITAMTYELLYYKLLVIVDTAKLQVTAMGLITLALPQDSPFVGIEVAVLASIGLKEGIIILGGQLTSKSYIIDPNARLQGDFGFCLWFAGEHQGDMVFSVGGYHPDFKKPTHYPALARVGFSWKVSEQVLISGTGYFAITPSTAMAGLKLEVAFDAGNVKAWFKAQTDLLLRWKPFYFEATIDVLVGASYKFNFFGTRTLDLEMSAKLFLYGPPVSGRIEVDLKVITLSISFGDEVPKETKEILEWHDFNNLFLPKPPKKEETAEAPKQLNTSEITTLKTNEEVCKINIDRGLIEEIQESGESNKTWVARGDELILSVDSYVPLTKLSINNEIQDSYIINNEIQKLSMLPKLGVYPMNIIELKAEHFITIKHKDASKLVEKKWHWQPVIKNVPLAMWSPVSKGKMKSAILNNETLKGLTGITQLYIKEPELSDLSGLPKSPIENFAYIKPQEKNKELKLTFETDSIGLKLENGDSLKILKDTVNKPEIKKRRNKVINTVNLLLKDLYKNSKKYSPEIEYDKELKELASKASDAFLAPPKLGKIVKNGTIVQELSQVITARNIEKEMSPIWISIAPAPPQLLFAFSTYSNWQPLKTKLQTARSLDSLNTEHVPTTWNVEIGQNIVCQLDDKPQTIHEVQYDGQISLQVVSFNQYDQVINIQSTPTGNGGVLLVNSTTEQLSIMGITSAQNKMVELKGWQVDFPLVMVNPQALIAERVTVRTQVPMQLNKKELVTVRSVNRHNRIMAGNSKSSQGWLYTTAFGALKEIVVTIESQMINDKRNIEKSLNDLRITLSSETQPTTILTSTNYQQKGDELKIHFKLPTALVNGADSFVIGSYISNNWTINSLILLCSEKPIKDDYWENCQLERNIFPTLDNYQATSEVSLTYNVIEVE